MKKTGRFYFIFAALFIGAFFPQSLTAAGNVNAELSKKTAAVGETVRLTINIEGAGTDIAMPSVPVIDGLNIFFSGTGRVFRYINGKIFNGVTLTYNITPLKEGRYNIPAFEFKYGKEIYSTEALSLSVSQRSAIDASTDTQIIKGICEVSASEAFVGEPLLLRYYICSSGSSVEFNHIEKMPEFSGFMIKQIDEQIPDAFVKDEGGELLKEYLHTFILIPAESGEKSIGGGAAIFTSLDNRSFFNFSRQGRLLFEKKRVKVKPLPQNGRPSDFTGNVGSFTMKTEVSSGDVKIFDEKKAMITIQGRGNFLSAAKPVFVSSDSGVKAFILDGKPDFTVDGDSLSGKIDFEASLVPEKPGQFEAGRFRFDFYDTASKTYKTVESELVKMNVTGDADEQETIDFNSEKSGVNWPVGFAVVFVLVVLGGLVFVILKERNRYDKPAARGGLENGAAAPKTPDYERLKREIITALMTRDVDSFLRKVDLLYNAARADESFAKPEFEAIAAVKDEIYSLRFGGGSISDEAMDKWLRNLKNAWQDAQPAP